MNILIYEIGNNGRPELWGRIDDLLEIDLQAILDHLKNYRGLFCEFVADGGLVLSTHAFLPIERIANLTICKDGVEKPLKFDIPAIKVTPL